MRGDSANMGRPSFSGFLVERPSTRSDHERPATGKAERDVFDRLILLAVISSGQVGWQLQRKG